MVSISASGSCLMSCLRLKKGHNTRQFIGSSCAAGSVAGSKQLTVEEESWDRLALAIAKVRKAV
jgi:hypothetical protein